MLAKMSSAAASSAAFIGAVVADAASLGIHWIYDKEKMSAAVPAGTNPEFRPIQTTWHAARTAGDTTMYGEGALLMAKTLVAKGGVYKEAAFKSAWYAAFGPCGTYSGYADKTTRLSVYNMMKLQVEHEKDTWPAPGLDPRVQAAMMPVFRSLAEDHSGDALTHAALDVAKKAAPDADAASLAWVEKAADAWDTILHTPIGAHDDQSNTIGKLIPVAVAYAGHHDFASAVASSIRCTQDHDDAVAWFLPLARMVEAVVLGKATTPRQAVDAGLPHFKHPHIERVNEAIVAASSTDSDAWDVVRKFGPGCASSSTVPNAIYMLLRHGGNPTYVQAIRENMLTGGESAARACFIGAILGGIHGIGSEAGVPQAWIDQVSLKYRQPLLEVAGKLVPAATTHAH